MCVCVRARQHFQPTVGFKNHRDASVRVREVTSRVIFGAVDICLSNESDTPSLRHFSFPEKAEIESETGTHSGIVSKSAI